METNQGKHRRTRALISLLVVVGFVAVIAFGWFVWPTPYRYDHLPVGDSSFPARIGRLTNIAEVLFPGQDWVSIGNQSDGHSAPWNSSVLSAKLSEIAVHVPEESPSGRSQVTLNFLYAVRNNTKSDYVASGDSRLYKVPHGQNTLVPDTQLSWNGGYFPSEQTVNVTISLSVPTPRSAQEMENLVKESLSELDRFVVLDPSSRYEIRFSTAPGQISH